MTQKPGRHGSSVLVSPGTFDGDCTAKIARAVRALEGTSRCSGRQKGLLADRIRDSPEQAGVSGLLR